MSYERYLARYNWRVKRLKNLGLTYCRKIFWKLGKRQIKKYARIQLQSMLDAIYTLGG